MSISERMKAFFQIFKFKEAIESLLHFLNQQIWFQELKTSWQELPPDRKRIIQQVSLTLGISLTLFQLGSWVWSNHRLKNTLEAKKELLTFIERSNQELDELKDFSHRHTQTSLEPTRADLSLWEKPYPHNPEYQKYFNSIAQKTGLDSTHFTLSPAKEGPKTLHYQETLLNLQLRKVNVRQLVQYLLHLEQDWVPIQLRALTLKAKPELDGYLDASLALSVFSLSPPESLRK